MRVSIMRSMILLIFLHHLNAEVIKIPLYPTTRVKSMLGHYNALYKWLHRKWMNVWTDEYTPTSEYLDNFENFQYYGEVFVGTPPEKFTVQFDTGSTDAWFPSRKCWFLDVPCWFFRFYDNSKSSTYQPNGTRFEVNYLMGSFSGFWSMDTIQINSLVIRNQAFGEVTSIFNTDFISQKYDGIIGMSCRSVSRYGNIPFFPNIIATTAEMDPVFSFYLSRRNGAPVGGELVLGGVNPEYIEGDFENLSVIYENQWAVKMRRASAEQIILPLLPKFT
ncbi:unnamed protein product [Heterobilharzia americana]|nr:unnamed protein product [Heterobilharzia americana]CAH8541722.1 unnamed protein product [Heterobilharzia americana]